MRDMKSIVGELIAALEEFTDPKRVEKSKTYFPTSQRVLGVTNPHVKTVTDELKQLHAAWTSREWIELCKALVDCDIFECQIMAYGILDKNKKLLDVLTLTDLEDLWKNLDNWASVDHFTIAVYGVLWGKGVVTDVHIDKLLGSDNFWDRRVAVVSTVALNLKSRGGKGDTARTISVCERVVDERQDMIQKALSWALRELSKRDKQSVINFMNRYESRLAKRVVREVSHKLDFGTKN